MEPSSGTNVTLNKPKFLEVAVEPVDLGGPYIPRILEVVGFGEGYVATLVELGRLRASTLVERGNAWDHIDFVLLDSLARRRKVKLPYLGEDEIKLMIKVEMCEEC
ncbi:hypothetical protein B7494_g6424 [Chlorociboria aeruginascens]|nr:hypothetical protein B7494_g6424 [Chlorociboria aeruginascens]